MNADWMPVIAEWNGTILLWALWGIGLYYCLNTFAFLIYLHLYGERNHGVRNGRDPVQAKAGQAEDRDNAIVLPAVHGVYTLISFYLIYRLCDRMDAIQGLIQGQFDRNIVLGAAVASSSVLVMFSIEVVTALLFTALMVNYSKFVYTINALDHGIINHTPVRLPTKMRWRIGEYVHRLLNIGLFIIFERSLATLDISLKNPELGFFDSLQQIGFYGLWLFIFVIAWAGIHTWLQKATKPVFSTAWFVQLMAAAFVCGVILVLGYSEANSFFRRNLHLILLLNFGVIVSGSIWIIGYIGYGVLRNSYDAMRDILTSAKTSNEDWLVLVRAFGRKPFPQNEG